MDICQFDKFYQDNLDRIYRYVFFRIGQNHDLAEDLVAEIFMKALKKFASYDSQQSKTAWIFTIAHNHLANYWRDRKPELELTDSMFLAESTTTMSADLALLLAKLSPEENQLVTLHYLDGYNYAEMAEILGRSAGALKVATHRALKKLKSISQ